MKNKQLNLDLQYPKLDISFRDEEEVITKKTTYVTVEGETFELEDLLFLLEAVSDGDIVVDNNSVGKHLMKIEVLKYLGNRRSFMEAEKGPAFKQLLDCLSDYYYKE